MAGILTCLALLCLICASAAFEKRIKKPIDCDRREVRFRGGHQYLYHYSTTVETSFVGTTKSKSAFKLNCDVVVEARRKCEAYMNVTTCSIYHRQPGDADLYLKDAVLSEDITSLLGRELYFQFGSGTIRPHTIVVDQVETNDALNIKRGILSALQIKLVTEEPGEQTHTMETEDLFGSCPTEYIVETPNRIHTSRDITKCQVPQYNYRQNNLISMIKSVYGGYVHGVIDELIYPFNSTIECEHTTGKKHRLEETKCLQQQLFRPFAHEETIIATCMTNVSQHLVLQETRNLAERNVDRKMKGKKSSSLRYEFDIQGNDIQVTKRDISRWLQTLTTYNETMETTPKLFHDFLWFLRQARTNDLMEVLKDVWDCHGNHVDYCNKTEQRLEKDNFLDGLLSCGTDACITVFTRAMRAGHVNMWFEYVFLYNFALLQEPSTEVATSLLEMCIERNTGSCWLPLSILISKIRHKGGSTEDMESEPVYRTLGHVREIIGDICHSGISKAFSQNKQHNITDELLLMIKVLGNIGKPVQYVYDSKYTGMEGGPGDRRLVQALLQCAYNTDLPHKVSKAAVLALHKMTFSPEMKDVLFGILVDLNRPPSLRTAIFERLVLQPDRDLATKLHDLVYTEKMIYMENYMITYIKSLLQNDQPDLQHLRNIWQDLIDSDSRAFPYGSRQIGKSKYIEMSRYIRFPLSMDYHGFQIELDTVYNIASPIVNAIVLRVSYFAGHKINLLEVAADIDDFHVLVNEITRILPLGVPIQPRNSHRETVFATLQKDIVAAILEMFDEINLPQKSIPDGLIHVKVLGKEVCFLDIRDLQKTLLNKRSGQSFINTSKRYFYAILEQLPMYRTSSTSLVDIVKVLPTVGGFPLNMTISVAMTIGLGFNAKLTMPDILKLNTDAQLDTSIKSHSAVHLNGELMTRFGQHSLSGARASSYGLLQMSLEPSLRVNTQPYPGRPLDISVTQTNTDSKYNIARLSGTLYLMTPSGEMEEVEPDQEIQTTIHDCGRGLLSAVTGNQVCFTGVFPNTTSSTSHPYFPLSGPFHFSLDTRKVETENFQNSTFRILKFEDHLWINLTRQGIEIDSVAMVARLPINKVVKIRDSLDSFAQLRQDKKNGLILHIETRDYLHQVEMLIPAAQLHFYVKKDYTWSYGVISTDYQIYDFHLSEAGTSIIRFLVKVQGNKTLSRNRISILTKRRIVDVTLAIPGASLAVTVHSFKNKTSGHYNNAFNITYHCIKDRPLMYLLHWNPTLAVLNGDTSTVQFVNDVVSGYIGDTNIWRANDYMQLNLPGLKVSLDNNIEGNMTHANHQAVIVYGGALGQEHTLTMDAHVTNSSNTTYNSYNCYMLLSHTAMPYNLSVWGFLKGTSQNLYILAEIEHVAISNAVQETPLVRDSNKNDSEDWLIGLSGIGNAESSGTDDCMKIPIRKVAALTVARVPVPDGIELRWDLNYTKQLCEGHVLYRTSGVYGRQPVNTRSNFHYWFTADAAITESSNSEGQHKPVVSTKSYKGRFIFHVEHLESIHLLLDYSSQLVNTSYVLRTYEIPKKSKCALFHYKLHTPWPLFNFNIRHFYNWTDHLIHEMDVALAFVDVDTVSHYHMRLFSDLFKIEVNGAINSRLPWLQGRSNITGYFKQHVSHGILPQLLVAAETSEGTLELKADMINTTISTTNITFQKPNDEIAHLFTWDIALTSSRAITHTFSWNSDLVNLLLQGAGTKVNQLRLALLEAGEVALRNAGKSTHLMVIPFTNMTLGAMLESYLYPHMRINMNDSDPRSLYMDDKSLNMSDDVGNKGSNQPGTPWPYEANIVVAGNEVLGIMSRTIGETLKTMDRVIFRPPRIVNCVGNYLLRPTIQKILSESRLTFTLPVIGHWQTLLSSPHGTYGYRYLKGVFKRLTSKDPVKSDKSVTAYIINRQYVITYYGQHYHIPDDEAADCVHLLAADFDRETFAILLSRQGITVVTSEMSIMLEFGGNVFRDNCPRPVQLPLGCNGCQTRVFMEGDDVVLTITNGVRVSCRHQREVCSIQLTGKHFSHSWGLLGSNDGEPGSDFQLPNKHITSLTNNFIHGYAVGGPPKCISSKYSHQNETNEVINPHHRSPSNVTTRCSTEMADECNRQFMHASNYSTCDSYVSSQQFLDSCLSEARNCDRVASDACKHINAYEYACHLNVVYDILHVNCSIDTSSFVEGSRQPVDIVMVMSENLGSSRSDLEAHMETFLHHVKYSLHNVQLGIIGYGDDVEITDALDLTLSSRYMVALERLDVGMDISPWRKAWKRFPNVNTMNEALDMAANYPYRLNTQRVVIVISREKNPYISNSVKSRYEDMNIIVNSFGDYESINPSNKVNGINWDSTVVYRDWMSAYRVLSLPEGDLVELVINTKGTIFNADTIFNRRKKRLRFILKHIKEQIQLNNVC